MASLYTQTETKDKYQVEGDDKKFLKRHNAVLFHVYMALFLSPPHRAMELDISTTECPPQTGP